ncbi:MAG: hypothetical protein JW910_05710 [Anaerolineae bacterium]|nr:hypothetical protein [Anaerolineae bacterium]
MGNTSQKSSSRVVVALSLIALGILFWIGIGVFWPMFILVPGLIFLAAALYGGKATAPLAIPGMLLAGTGGLLFIQNVTGHWDSWAYAWTLYGVFLGSGLVIMGRLLGETTIQSVGRGCMTAGLIAFVGFAFLFELVIGIGSGIGAAGWALVLIAAGSFLLLRNTAGRPALSARTQRLKAKQRDEQLFTGPVVYGSRKRATHDPSRLSTPEDEPPSGTSE